MTFYKEGESAKLSASSSVKIKRGIFGSMANADKDLVFKNTNAVGEIVDLGLSVKWASWNLGASSPEEYGDYFAWGEIEPKADYPWETYLWGNGTSITSITKYCPSSNTDYWDGTGSPDDKVLLNCEYDAAHVNWGGSWRMPTDEEWTELRDNCTWIWTDDYNGTGVAGRIVTSNKSGYSDKSIFLPAAGNKYDDIPYSAGSYGTYWSSSLNTEHPYSAWSMGFYPNIVYWYYDYRYGGQSVRPVFDDDEPNPEDIIQFADPVAKYACVEKFDTNHDGEVSYAEAAAVTSLDGLFTDWNTVTSFDELEYFTSVTTIGTAMQGLSNLSSVVIPRNVTSISELAFRNCSALSSVVFKTTALTTIGKYAFQSCSSLVSISLPSTIVSIGDYAFDGCFRLQSFSVPSGVKSLGSNCFQRCTALFCIELPSSLGVINNYAFDHCSSLQSIDLPGNLYKIGDYAFRACSSLVSVSIPNTVTSLGAGVFYECGILETVSLPDELTVIPAYTFYKCHKLHYSIPEGVTEIGDYAFYGILFETNRVSRLDIPSTVTKVGSGALMGPRAVVFNATAPVVIASNEFRDIARIYVPSGMVEMYKVRTNWSYYSDNIYPIDEYVESIRPDGTVDMGLSVFWTIQNIGASSPEEYGDYYAWGGTENVWGWNGYFDNPSGDGSTFIKYFNGEGGKTSLELEDDTAHILLGNGYRMPTQDELSSLVNLSSYWSTLNGVNGRVFVSSITGESLFLPAAGGYDRAGFQDRGSRGRYWSSTLSPKYSSSAWSVWFTSSGASMRSATNGTDYYDFRRCDGYTIRPVCD